MNDTSHTSLSIFQFSWKEKFEIERKNLQQIFGSVGLGIEHIGSTAVEGLASKPIIDIGVLIKKKEDADKFVEPLSRLGYRYDKPNSSGERHFFRKGKPTEFHLSIAYVDKGNFWERQILFRDYLRTHVEARDQYALLKGDLLKNDLTGGNGYVSGKTEFVERILHRAKQEGLK